MKAPEFPADERTRLETLRSLQILDTLPEERFDRLTRLARKLFDVPIALVSLIDADRQWFKSSAGLEAKETPREISFCGHAILTEDILAVTDTALDERFHDNPLVTGDPKIRFYAGCPLIVSNGKLGTLCLIGQEPREFDENDRALLHDLARIVEQELSAVQLATRDELTGLLNRRGFEALSQQLARLRLLVQAQVDLRAPAGADGAPDAGEAGGAAAAGPPGTIRSPQDATRALEAVAEYFRRNEPSSPVPLLLDRAKRLVSKSFLEVLEEMAPEGLPGARAAGGLRESSE